MSESFIYNLIEVVLTALAILTFQITLIVLGSRFGWFLWVIKKFLHIRSKYLHKKLKSKRHSYQEE